ncbi:MAG: ATP-binding protein [Dehalococcoidia bacterium]|nr:ATP-binding protein [Dehalococcoidia bacterium]
MPIAPPADARDLARMWQAVLGRLEVELMPATFETWLRGTRALRVEAGTLIAEGGRPFECDQLNSQLQVVVRRAVQTITGEELEVHFIPSGTGESEPDVEPHRRPGGGGPSRWVFGATNCSYTFERYLPAAGNRLAYQSCSSLLEEDELRISPVVVFGSPGMGKSHLLHALACRAAAAGWPVACLTAEDFTNRYQAALRKGEADAFQAAVRGARVLILDDLQYLSGKKGTQDELVHTIDAITNAGGHVAIGSERHPFDLDLLDRLASRLAAGIITRVDPLLLDERREFIARQARQLRVSLPAWATERIANLEVPSVRVLQGAVHAAIALSRADLLDPARLDAELMRVSLAEVAPAACTDRSTLEAVARHFETTFEELAGRSRKAALPQARAVAVAILRERGRSLTEIAALLGGRDKSTISQLAERGHAALAGDAHLRRLAG